MELDNRSFTSKMMQRIGELVSGTKRSNSVSTLQADLEKMSTTTDSSAGEGKNESVNHITLIIS